MSEFDAGVSPVRSRTAEVIDGALQRGRAALVAYLPAGYPTIPVSMDAIERVAGAGADIIEIGMPYSDPGMDGPVIARAGAMALDGGVRVRHLFDAAQAAARGGALPLAMTYWNPIERYGVERFARDFASAGGAGLITPDLPPEEAAEWIAASDAHGLDRVFLVAPTSTQERLRLIAGASRGFVYAASTMGVTGARAAVDDGAQALVERTRAAGAGRVCVGLGVSTPTHAAEIACYADGVIVGSALIRALQGAETDPGAGLEAVATLTAQLARGCER